MKISVSSPASDGEGDEAAYVPDGSSAGDVVQHVTGQNEYSRWLCRVNGKQVDEDYEISEGDHVTIVPAKVAGAKRGPRFSRVAGAL